MANRPTTESKTNESKTSSTISCDFERLLLGDIQALPSRKYDVLLRASLRRMSPLELVRFETGPPKSCRSNEIKRRLWDWGESFSAMRCHGSTVLHEAFAIDFGGEA